MDESLLTSVLADTHGLYSDELNHCSTLQAEDCLTTLKQNKDLQDVNSRPGHLDWHWIL